MATLKEIADVSGVSVRTVSRALKNNGYVRKEIRQRVLSEARKLSYRPNRIAQSLKTRRSFEILVIIHDMKELYMEKIAGMEEILREEGYSISLLFRPEKARSSKDSVIDEVILRKPAGIVAFNPSRIALVRKHAEAEGIPLAFFGRPPASAYPCVEVDRTRAVYEAVLYLHGKGYRSIAYMGFGKSGNYENRARVRGYLEGLEEIGATPEYLLVDGEDQFLTGRKCANQFLDLSRRPRAVIAYTDIMALGFMNRLHDCGVNIPGDVAVVGFDDRPCAAVCWPGLTTIAQPNRAAGRVMAEILMARIEGKKPFPQSDHRFVLPQMVIRESA